MNFLLTKVYNRLDRTINATVKRSPYYPLPRDLGFDVEKPLLRRWAKGKTNLVEIGVFEGASGAILRAAMEKNATLHLIDPFIPDSMNATLRARRWFAYLNLARVRNGRVRWYRDFSHHVIKNWRDEIDFLFIDGDHMESSCLQDWESWSPFVVPNGIVIFHDARYGSSHGKFWDGWEGPTNIVNRLFRGNILKNWRIVDEAGTAVAVQRIK